MVIILGLLCSIGIAVANIYLKVLFKGISTREVAPLSLFLTAITMIFIVPFFYKLNLTYHLIIFMLFAFVFDTLGIYYSFKAIENSHVTYASILGSLAPIFTLLIYSLFLGQISIKTLVGIIGVIVSVFFINLQETKLWYEPFIKLFKDKNYYGLLWAFFSGVGVIFTKQALTTGNINVMTLYTLRTWFIALAFLIVLKPDFSLYKPRIVFLTWTRTIVIIINSLLLFFAVYFGNVVVASTLSYTFPIFVIIMSRIIFKEKIQIHKVIATITAVAFITLITI